MADQKKNDASRRFSLVEVMVHLTSVFDAVGWVTERHMNFTSSCTNAPKGSSCE